MLLLPVHDGEIMKYPIRRFEYANVVYVVDGDSLDAKLDLGFSVKVKHRFRLSRVDTPERGQPGYDEAKRFMVNTVLDKDVVLDVEKLDKYGRYLAEIYVNGVNVNDLLLSTGLAKPYE